MDDNEKNKIEQELSSCDNNKLDEILEELKKINERNDEIDEEEQTNRKLNKFRRNFKKFMFSLAYVLIVTTCVLYVLNSVS